ncbi:MAG: hypothetical protein ACI90Y_001015 [Polaromonas sp.]|jgi:hypothetical protein
MGFWQRLFGTRTPDATMDTHKVSLTPERIRETHHAGRGTPPRSLIVRQIETQLRGLLSDPEICVISVHGPSKQGKTSLISTVLKKPGLALCVEASAHAENPIAELYALLLTDAGAEIVQSTTTSVGAEGSITASVILPTLNVGAKFSRARQQTKVKAPVSGSLSNAAWVARLLKQATPLRIICIDSFHHFEHDVQRALARDFTLFANEGFKIVVAGTWKQRGFIVEQNGDLQGQNGEVDVNDWPDEDMLAVINAGEGFLGTDLGDAKRRALVRQAFGSIGALQMTCRKLYELQLQSASSDEPPPSQVVNRAAQIVSAEQCETLAQTAYKVSKFGQKDEAGRHVASFVIEAMLNRSFRELEAGLDEKDVLGDAQDCVRKWATEQETQPLIFAKQTFNRHRSNQWAMMQAECNTTPVFVWDKSISKYVVNDAMLMFVHHTNSSKLRILFRQAMLNRDVAL